MATNGAGPTSADVYAVLQSIDATMKELLALSKAKRAQSAVAAGPAVASDKDLDGEYGNPIVRAKDPRDWSGDSMQGRHLSDCSPDYLDLCAARADYFADQAAAANEKDDKGRPVAQFKRRDAARFRGWALRLRNGWKAPDISAQANPWGTEGHDPGF
jgi:hypothetical protein